MAAGCVTFAGTTYADDHGPHCYLAPVYGPAPYSGWNSRQDWRTVDWNCAGFGCGVHRKTQAFSLHMEAYFNSRRCWPPASYHRFDVMDTVYDQPMCGPRSTRRPKDDCD